MGVPYRKKETQREGFVCAGEEGSHCIIYNSGLKGKLIKPKNTVSVAYIRKHFPHFFPPRSQGKADKSHTKAGKL